MSLKMNILKHLAKALQPGACSFQAEAGSNSCLHILTNITFDGPRNKYCINKMNKYFIGKLPKHCNLMLVVSELKFIGFLENGVHSLVEVIHVHIRISFQVSQCIELLLHVINCIL